MRPCRACGCEVSAEAMACPHCGAPYPSRDRWNGWGYEYKSKITLIGLPLVHVSFKYRPNRVPVVAKGIIAIGQFACGFITFAQLGIGIISIGQIAFGVWVLAQLGIAYSIIAQCGIYVHSGYGQIVRSMQQLLAGH